MPDASVDAETAECPGLKLGLEWDPATTGAVADEVLGVGVEDVREAILAQYAERATLTPRPLDAEELAAANELVGRYRV